MIKKIVLFMNLEKSFHAYNKPKSKVEALKTEI